MEERKKRQGSRHAIGPAASHTYNSGCLVSCRMLFFGEHIVFPCLSAILESSACTSAAAGGTGKKMKGALADWASLMLNARLQVSASWILDCGP